MYCTTKRILVQVDTTKLIPEFVYWEGEKYPVKIYTKCNLKRYKTRIGQGIRFWCSVGGRHVGLVYDSQKKTWTLEVATSYLYTMV